ncbi:RNA polymerase sigma-70 factor (ECF subfamily) [Sporosarcina luteola]|nr:RNA polymerase sigma-70 factor (ECF subfamily) [Sporosarcina luteola]
MNEDSVLVRAILQGDEEAMEQLVYRYYDEIFYYINQIGAPYEEAKDITQEVFISMLKALPKYKEQGHFKAWIYRIAYNKSMNHFRQSKYVTTLSEAHEEVAEDDIGGTVENQSLVKELLDSLPQKQSSALILKYFHGFTASEIAKVMGVSLPTAKSRIFQGLKKLKKRLKEDEN